MYLILKTTFQRSIFVPEMIGLQTNQGGYIHAYFLTSVRMTFSPDYFVDQPTKLFFDENESSILNLKILLLKDSLKLFVV